MPNSATLRDFGIELSEIYCLEVHTNARVDRVGAKPIGNYLTSGLMARLRVIAKPHSPTAVPTAKNSG